MTDKPALLFNVTTKPSPVLTSLVAPEHFYTQSLGSMSTSLAASQIGSPLLLSTPVNTQSLTISTPVSITPTTFEEHMMEKTDTPIRQKNAMLYYLNGLLKEKSIEEISLYEYTIDYKNIAMVLELLMKIDENVRKKVHIIKLFENNLMIIEKLRKLFPNTRYMFYKINITRKNLKDILPIIKYAQYINFVEDMYVTELKLVFDNLKDVEIMDITRLELDDDDVKYEYITKEVNKLNKEKRLQELIQKK